MDSASKVYTEQPPTVTYSTVVLPGMGVEVMVVMVKSMQIATSTDHQRRSPVQITVILTRQ